MWINNSVITAQARGDRSLATIFDVCFNQLGILMGNNIVSIRAHCGRYKSFQVDSLFYPFGFWEPF